MEGRTGVEEAVAAAMQENDQEIRRWAVHQFEFGDGLILLLFISLLRIVSFSLFLYLSISLYLSPSPSPLSLYLLFHSIPHSHQSGFSSEKSRFSSVTTALHHSRIVSTALLPLPSPPRSSLNTLVSDSPTQFVPSLLSAPSFSLTVDCYTPYMLLLCIPLLIIHTPYISFILSPYLFIPSLL